MSDDRTQERIEKLREAADTSARSVRTGFFTFLLVGVYIGIIIGSTTDEQLLRETGIRLPLLNVDLPIVGVYMFVPPLFMLLHFNLLLQLTFLSRCLHRLDSQINTLRIAADRDSERDLIFAFPFSHLIVGRHHGAAMRMVIRVLVWITLMILPVALLLWAQVQFLPYHSEPVTWGAHRLSLVADFAILWFFWPRLFAPDGKWRPWRRGLTGRVRAGILRLATGVLSSFGVAWLSLFVLVIPGERLELVTMRPVIAHVFGDDGYGKTGGGKWHERWFHRNLVLPERTLVAQTPAPEIVAAYLSDGKSAEQAFFDFGEGLDLHGRDLRFASLSEANLMKANMRSTILQGANLSSANLQRANLSGAVLDGASLVFAELNDAILFRAKLSNADLIGAGLRGADLRETKLQSAQLIGARLQGANLARADLRGAHLGGAKLQGAFMVEAALQGANMWAANLEGAVLSRAQLQGANLSGAKLNGALLGGARLEGADLSPAFLGGADLTGASLLLADIRGASFTLPTAQEWDQLRSIIGREDPYEVANPETGSGIDAKALMDFWPLPSKTILPDYKAEWNVMYDAAPEFELDVQHWPLTHWPPPDLGQKEYRAKLVPFLLGLACGDKYVARGIVSQIVGFRLGARTEALALAKALLDRAEEDQDCPGLAALPPDTLARLKEKAGE